MVTVVSYQHPVSPASGSNTRSVTVMSLSCTTTGAWNTKVVSEPSRVKNGEACPPEFGTSTAALSIVPTSLAKLSSNTISQSKR